MDSETPVTIEALLGYVRNDIATLREDNVRQHGEIVHRLDTLNGRVHRHDREIDSIGTKVSEIHAVAETVKTIEANYLTKTQGWTGFTFVVAGFAAAFIWLLDHFIK